jgi:hypothetical protein
MSKRYITDYLVDGSGNQGHPGQVLTATPSGIKWQDSSHDLNPSGVIAFEKWSRGDNELAKQDLGTWTQSGGALVNSVTHYYIVDDNFLPDGLNYIRWAGSGQATFTSPTIDLRRYQPLVAEEWASEPEVLADSTILISCWMATQSMDSAAEYLVLEVNSTKAGGWIELARTTSDDDENASASNEKHDTTWRKIVVDITPYVDSDFQLRFKSFGTGSGDSYGVSSIFIHEGDIPRKLELKNLTVLDRVGIGQSYLSDTTNALHVDGGIHLDGEVIIDTQTGAQPFYITRDGASNQALKIYVDDAAAIFESIQDETIDNYGAFQFVLDSGVTEPYFDIRKGTASAGVLFRVDGDGTVQLSGYGEGYLKTDASGNISVDTDTIEDTLDSVTGRGSSTTNAITVGPSAVEGGRFLSPTYSGTNRLGVLSSDYSSGNLLIGYGAEGKSGEAKFVSSYGNFSGGHSLLEFGDDALRWYVDASDSQTTVGDDLTLEQKFIIDRASAQFEDNLYVVGKLGVGVSGVNSANDTELHGQARINGDLFVGDASLANTANGNIHIKNSGSARIRLEDTDSTNVVFDLNSNEGSGFSIWEGSSSNTRFHIDQSTGSIKINGTSPTDKLHVGGRTRSEQGFYSAYGVYTDGGTYTNQWQKVCTFPQGNAFAFANAKILISEAGDTSGQQLHGEVYFSYKFQSNNGRVNVNIRSYGERELSAANIQFQWDSTNNYITMYHKVTSNYSRPYYTVLGYTGNGIVWSNTIVGNDTAMSSEPNDGFTEYNKRLSYSNDIVANTHDFYGDVEFDSTINCSTLTVNGVDQNSGSHYSNPDHIVSFTRTSAANSSNQWYKVISHGGSPSTVTLAIHCTGDNTNMRDEYLINTAGYGFYQHILRKPGVRYNGSKLLAVAAVNPNNGGNTEIWIKLNGMTSGSGSTYLESNYEIDDATTISSTATTTAPSITANDALLEVDANDRNYATLMLSRSLCTENIYSKEDVLSLQSGGPNGSTRLDIDDASGIYLFAEGDVTIDNGQINLSADGTNHVEFRESGAGLLTIDAPDDIILDVGSDIILDAAGNDIRFKSDGTEVGVINMTSSNLTITSTVSNKDMIFEGNDGGTTITALTLDMSAAGKATFNNDVIAFSDRKLKKDIKTLDGSKVYDMRGVSFTRIDTGSPSSGVIAQEMQEVAPELVSETNGTLGVSYGNITGYLIEAIKDLKQEVEELKKQIKNGNNL